MKRLVAATLAVSITLVAAPQLARADSLDAAIELAKKAQEHLDARRFEKAAELFRSAYDISEEAPLLFNAARAEQRAAAAATGKKRLALYKLSEQHYAAYLEHDKAAKRGKRRATVELEQVRTNIKVVETALAKDAEAARARADAEAARRRAEEEARRKPSTIERTTVIKQDSGEARAILGWGTVGVGVLSAAGGGILLGVANNDAKTLNDKLAQQVDGTIFGTDHNDATEDANAIRTKRIIGWSMAGVGVAALGVGTWLALTAGDNGAKKGKAGGEAGEAGEDGEADKAAKKTTRLWVMPTGRGLAVGGLF
jgi:hypothetical protein